MFEQLFFHYSTHIKSDRDDWPRSEAILSCKRKVASCYS